MTYLTETETKQDPPQRRRIRFGLKTAFVVMTVLCLWLGWRMARQRQAAAVISRSYAVLDVIESNIATAPPNTIFTMPSHLRQRQANFLKQTRQGSIEQSSQLGSIFGSGRYYIMATRGQPLDITKLVATSDTKAASVQIRTHYEKGLAKLGLKRSLTSDGEKATAIWQMPDHGIHVVIDVHADQNQADVRVIFMHNETLSIW